MDKKLTLERLKDISQLGIIFAALLYVLGFLTVNAFLARFGIVSFDIINARYLIAGILCLIPLSIILWMAWHVGNKETYIPFSSNGGWERVKIGITVIFWSHFISSVFVQLFNAAALTNKYSTDKLRYDGLGKYDLSSPYLKFLDELGGMGFVLKMTASLSIWIILIVCFFYLLATILKFLSKRSTPKSEKPKVAASEEKPKEEKTSVQKPIHLFIRRCTEAILYAFIAALFTYAYNKIRIDIFDFDSFHETKLSQGTFFAWFFSSVAGTHILVSIIQDELHKPIKTIKPDFAAYVIQTVMVPIFVSVILFGQTIFPRIPYMIGGGQPREVQLLTSHPALMEIGTGSKLYLLGESSQFFYIAAVNADQSKALQINKNEVEFMTTKIGSGSAVIKSASGSSIIKTGTGEVIEAME